MRVLFVTPMFPSDPSRSISGSTQRMRIWLEAIQSTGADLELLILAPSEADASPAAAERLSRALADAWGIRARVELCSQNRIDVRPSLLERYVWPLFTIAWHSDFRAFAGRRQAAAVAAAVARSPDVIFFHKLHSAVTGYRPRGDRRILMDLDDIEHRKYWRQIGQPPLRGLKPLRTLWLPALWWAERRALALAENVAVCSQIDKDQLRRAMGLEHVTVIPNSAARVEDRPLSAEPNILFLGTYGYPPNRVAAEFLVTEVWPLLSRLRPDARLLIAGPRSEEIPSFHNPPAGVEFLGFVPDLDALYARTRIFCCAIQSGGGTRVKILEATNHGVPVVSTAIGAEGIELAPEREILLRDDADGLAKACAELLADPQRAELVGTRGRERVRELYGRETIIGRMRAMLAGAGKTPPAR